MRYNQILFLNVLQEQRNKNVKKQCHASIMVPFWIKQFTASVSHSYRINYALSTYTCIDARNKKVIIKHTINYTMHERRGETADESQKHFASSSVSW